MNNTIGILITVIIVFLFMYILGKCFKSDLKDLEETNPKYRQFLKDKYKI